MKIAVASKQEMVSEHFGHCPNFNFFEIVDGEILSEKLLDNPGTHCQGLPSFLKENGIEVLIAGGIGKGAMTNCSNRGIKVISGARGLAKEAALAYEKGDLESTGETCSRDHDHDHEHEHGHHHHH